MISGFLVHAHHIAYIHFYLSYVPVDSLPFFSPNIDLLCSRYHCMFKFPFISELISASAFKVLTATSTSRFTRASRCNAKKYIRIIGQFFKQCTSTQQSQSNVISFKLHDHWQEWQKCSSQIWWMKSCCKNDLSQLDCSQGMVSSRDTSMKLCTP